jgi:ankyrin repeat protein
MSHQNLIKGIRKLDSYLVWYNGLVGITPEELNSLRIDFNGVEETVLTATFRLFDQNPSESFKIADGLLEAGGDPNILNSMAESPLAILMKAQDCVAKHRCIKRMLEWGANPNHPYRDSITIFHEIISRDNLELLEACLKAGANVHNPNAAIVAINRGSDDSLKFLLDYGRLSQTEKEDAYNFAICIEHTYVLLNMSSYIPKAKRKNFTASVSVQ